jgi:hypothetical protein
MSAQPDQHPSDHNDLGVHASGSHLSGGDQALTRKLASARTIIAAARRSGEAV